MGLLDDAIREHLDLKRRRGADPTEVEREEREVLGPVRRRGEPARSDEPAFGHAYEDEPRADESYSWDEGESEEGGEAEEAEPLPRPTAFDHEQIEPLGFRDEPYAPPEREAEPYVQSPVEHEPDPFVPPAREPEHEPPYTPAAREPEPYVPPPRAPEPEPYIPPPRTPEPEPHAAPAAREAEPYAAHEPQDTEEHTAEFSVEEALEREDHPHPHPPKGEEEDVLEETPEFLQDTPDHDRLWFEQRPPRDFDFDG